MVEEQESKKVSKKYSSSGICCFTLFSFSSKRSATWSNSWAGVDLPEERLMQANDIAIAVMGAWKMSPSAVVEDLIIRPQLGDL